MENHKAISREKITNLNEENFASLTKEAIFLHFNSTPPIMKNAQKEKASVKDYKQPLLVNGIKIITKQDIQETLDKAVSIKRGREPILIHNDFNEQPQRFINCLHSHSYVRPHMHTDIQQWELMTWLSGQIIALFFDHKGKVTHRFEMGEEGIRVLEIPPFVFHTFYTINSGAYLEVRNCAYNPKVDRVYAPWSVEENTKNVKTYHAKFFKTQVNDTLTF